MFKIVSEYYLKENVEIIYRSIKMFTVPEQEKPVDFKSVTRLQLVQ